MTVRHRLSRSMTWKMALLRHREEESVGPTIRRFSKCSLTVSAPALIILVSCMSVRVGMRSPAEWLCTTAIGGRREHRGEDGRDAHLDLVVAALATSATERTLSASSNVTTQTASLDGIGETPGPTQVRDCGGRVDVCRLRTSTFKRTNPSRTVSR
jgi:hypothetical protein